MILSLILPLRKAEIVRSNCSKALERYAQPRHNNGEQDFVILNWDISKLYQFLTFIFLQVCMYACMYACVQGYALVKVPLRYLDHMSRATSGLYVGTSWPAPWMVRKASLVFFHWVRYPAVCWLYVYTCHGTPEIVYPKSQIQAWVPIGIAANNTWLDSRTALNHTHKDIQTYTYKHTYIHTNRW